MTTERIVVLAEQDAAALGAIRTQPGLRVAAAGGQLWVRGLPATDELALALRQLPAVASYALDARGNLFPAGGLTPTGQLPALPWQPIREFVPLEIPTAALPGQNPLRYPVRLGPALHAPAGAALLTTLSAWQTYADTAPEVRLRCLRFAVSGTNQVLLLGTPLPPIPGQELWLRDGLLLPAGLDFETPLVSQLLARKLNPLNDALLLFTANGAWERVELQFLLLATRSAVRLTTGNPMHG